VNPIFFQYDRRFFKKSTSKEYNFNFRISMSLQVFKKSIVLLSILSFVFGCQKRNEVSEQSSVVIPDVEVSSQDTTLSLQQGILSFKGKLFSGFIIEKYQNGQIGAKMGYFNGKLEGKQEKFYPNGKPLEERFYRDNRKVGTHKGWWENGNQKFVYLIENDVPIGEHQEWYENGQLFSLTNFDKNGQPDGVQKTWYPTGQIKSNFVMKEGRRFGFIGAKGCMGENEKKVSGVGEVLKRKS
jgi:antitoxin component YwqK of YwqJK toxin-antitoxin module